MPSPVIQTELHRHLDCSLRLSTLLEFAQQDGLESQATTLAAFDQRFIMRKPMTDLPTVLAAFGIFQKVLRTPERLERVAFECVQDCYLEGTRAVELRFSPGFISEKNNLPWDQIIDAIDQGVARAQSSLASQPPIEVGLILIASRGYGFESAAKTAEYFLKYWRNPNSKMVGLDLADNEIAFPNELFKDAFADAIKVNAPITIHSGESTGAKSVWEALEYLGAKRIGHGVDCIQDPSLMKELARRQICLEICPTSNWLTQTAPTLAAHPLPQILRAGIPVCINTDDPGIFGLTLPHEIAICRTEMGMTQDEINQCMQHGYRHRFTKGPL